MRLSRAGTLGLPDLTVHAPMMERAYRQAQRAARSTIPILIEGEPGVGKELLACAIHGSSARRNRPFVKIRCGDELDPLSRATRQKMQEANRGTLFLDEIDNLPRAAQSAVAQMLAGEDLGPSTVAGPGRSDIRLIAATPRRLIDLVREGTFDEHLFHRLNVFPIWVPPLRERRADIPYLARAFLANSAGEAGRSFVTSICAPAMELLVSHDWPGNVRELQHAIFRAVMMCEGSELTPREFPFLATATEPIVAVAVQEQVYGESFRSRLACADTQATSRYGIARLLDEQGELRPFEVLEEEVIRFALDRYSGCMSEVARRLGIGRSTLYRKVRGYGIASGESAAS